ncbi:MAG: 2-hydroxychromene-2-carboxylate isomerase [Proteobacteria bacterium]|nr:2-hydroxychromene-2-carboxylate isomerase [Pseudomonadota bacterium]
MARQVELFWDAGSTNSYFALKLIPPLVARHGAQLILRPFNLGYVFRHHNYTLMDEPTAKLANRKRDLKRWAQRYGLPFRMPDVFPIKTSVAMRGAIAMRRWSRELEFVDALLRAYWEQNDHRIAELDHLAEIAARLGVASDDFVAETESDAVRQVLIDSTNEGLDRGVFGAPTTVVDGELYWGKDRLEFIEDALR